MEKISKKYVDLVKMHKALGNAIKRYKNATETHLDLETQEDRRDSTIKRFELTYDLLWKYLREYIATTQGLTFDSPRKVFQQCLTSNLTDIDETKQLLELIESRNLTSHTYDADLANEVAIKITHYFNVIHTIIMRVDPKNI